MQYGPLFCRALHTVLGPRPGPTIPPCTQGRASWGRGRRPGRRTLWRVTTSITFLPCILACRAPIEVEITPELLIFR